MNALQKALVKEHPTRRIDVYIDEFVMGVPWARRVREAKRDYEACMGSQAGAGASGFEKWEKDCEGWRKAAFLAKHLPKYSAEEAAAFLVIDRLARLKKRPWMVTIMNWSYYGDRTYSVKFRDSSLVNVEVTEYAKTFPEAVCAAARAVRDVCGGIRWPNAR